MSTADTDLPGCKVARLPRRPHADDLLLGLLLAGPMPAAVVRERGQAAGHAWRTMQDAATRLAVIRTKVGAHDGWVWQLPAEALQDARGRALEPDRTPARAQDSVDCLAAYPHEAVADGMMRGAPNFE